MLLSMIKKITQIVLLLIYFSVPHIQAQEVYQDNWKSGVNIIDSIIVNKTKEKVLFNSGEKNSTPVEALLVSFNSPAQKISGELKQAFFQRLNVNLEESKIVNGNLEEILKYMKYRYYKLDDLEKKMVGLAQVSIGNKLKSIGVTIDSLNGLSLKSNRINISHKNNSFSQYFIYIYDTENIFQKPGSLAIIFRMDEYTKWGWSSIHDPLGFGKHSYAEQFIDEALKDIIILNKNLSIVSIYNLDNSFFIDKEVNSKAWINIKYKK